MKSRTWTIVIAALSFLGGGIVGGIAGGYVVIDFMSGFFTDGWMLGKGVNVQTEVAILTDVHEGHTAKGMELLETLLDEDIVSLSVSSRFTSETNEAVRKAIAKAREYRGKYPRHSGSPELDRMIAKKLHQNGRRQLPE